jgi:uncharacterized protein GlcG (DUF336 family)
MFSKFFPAAFLLAFVAAPASAQVDPRFVVPPEVAAMTGEMNAINFATAEAIGKACLRLGAERGETMAVFITDNLGTLTFAGRADGDTLTSMMFAQRKAHTARLTRNATHLRENNVRRDPMATTREIYLGFLPNSGGLPIWVGDQIIGFIGVGGSNARPPEWSDEICAHRALEEVVGPQPALVENP